MSPSELDATIKPALPDDAAGKDKENRNEPPVGLLPDPQPIDLASALKLADAQSPNIALVRERIREALARQELAELLCVPNLESGATWMRHDGQIQRAVGEVFTTSRSSLFVGGGPALTLQLSDAIFLPLAARQVTAARQAGAAGVTNEHLLNVALAYLDLVEANMDRLIQEETYRNATHLLNIAEEYERVGKGVPADTARARTEMNRRARQRIEIQGRVGVASARLVQLLNLSGLTLLQPVEPAVVPIALVPEEMPLEELLSHAVASRPELAEERALVGATLEAWRAAKVAPWVPQLRLSYAAGGFGGGINSYFGDFDGRGDATITVLWQLQNLGLGNHALAKERHSQYAQANFRLTAAEARVINQAVAAFRVAYAKRRELAASQREVAAARDSYRLNEERIRRAPEQTRPIELLQAIQALAQARTDYLRVVVDYNRAQFRLYAALGHPPQCGLDGAAAIRTTESTVPIEEAPLPRPIEEKK